MACQIAEEPAINVNLCPNSMGFGQVSYSLSDLDNNGYTNDDETCIQTVHIVNLDKDVVVVSVEPDEIPKETKVVAKKQVTNKQVSKEPVAKKQVSKEPVAMIQVAKETFAKAAVQTVSDKQRTGNVACVNCNHKCPSFRALREHMRKCSVPSPNDNINCTLCDLTFTTSKLYHDHLLKTHYSETSDQCPICKKEFRKPSNLVHHLRIHSRYKVFECAQCELVFTFESHLISHVQLHAKKNQKTHKCYLCNKSFNHKSYFNLHLRTHKGVLPHQCLHCGKAFVQHSLLLEHLQRKHDAERKYKCSTCDRGFVNLTDKTVHERIHTGAKPYSCPECNKSFRQTSSLNRHRHIHTGIKPYHCTYCNNSFNDKSACKRHELICKVAK